MAKHILFEGSEPDCPDSIRDRNGDVALGLCRLCGAGEIELEQPCVSWQSRALAAEAEVERLRAALEKAQVKIMPAVKSEVVYRED